MVVFCYEVIFLDILFIIESIECYRFIKFYCLVDYVKLVYKNFINKIWILNFENLNIKVVVERKEILVLKVKVFIYG